MIDLFLSTNLKCEDAVKIIERIKKHEEMNNIIKQEIIVTLKESIPECKWDAND
jgi:hypothetical protein